MQQTCQHACMIFLGVHDTRKTKIANLQIAVRSVQQHVAEIKRMQEPKKEKI